MKILLDTHAFIWFVESNAKLSATAKALIENPNTEVKLSIASVWEMAIKVSTGKLSFTQPLDQFVPRQMAINRIELLTLEMAHTFAIIGLPFHHRDPFDRILLTQSLVENMPLVSNDMAFDQYGAKRIW